MARKFKVVDDAQGGGTSRHELEVADTALGVNNLDLGVSGTAGSLDIFPATASKGKLTISAADSAGDTATTITNASQAGARTYTIPDAGASASFVMTEGAQTLNGTYTVTTPVVEDHNTGITAFAGGGQGSATALTGRWNNVTTVATAADSVALLTAVAGQVQTVKNSGANTLAVFPATGDAINALAVNLSVDIPAGGELTFRAIDATTWETIESVYLPAPTTQTGGLEIKAADSAGNTTTTITNASQAAARTYTIPDAGASATFGLNITSEIDVKTRGVSFTEDGSGTSYTGTIPIPAGALLLDIYFWSTVLWDGTSASLNVGDDGDPDGFFAAVNLKATDLLVGEVLQMSNSEYWGGKNGAYLVAISGTRTNFYYSAANNVIGVVTPGAADGSAGRSFMVVTYCVPPFVASTNA